MAGSGGDTSKTVDNAATTKSWSEVASMNTSKRNQTNTLEVRLENDEKRGCMLNVEEIERLLKRLGLRSSHVTSVPACPERRSVVFITLSPGVDINNFINMNSNESYFLKPGLRTTTIKHANKKEVLVQVFGLHPDTKNETVIKYLNAQGQVGSKSPVRYGLYPGVPGSSLLAGKRNGNRIYSMVVKRNIGSSHVIDGEKVSVRYPGQIKTCNNCQQGAKSCPGKGLAKDCTLEKVLLSDFMLSYWKSINFQPDTKEMNLDDTAFDEDASEPAQIDQVDQKPKKVIIDSEMMGRYGGVVIKGFRKETDIDKVVEVLKNAGLPDDYEKEDLQIKEKADFNTISIQLKPEVCVELYNNLHGEVKFGRTITVYNTVDGTPIKQSGAELEMLIDNTKEVGDIEENCDSLEKDDKSITQGVKDVENLTNSDTDEKCDDEECSKQTPENISKGYKVENKKSPSSSSGLIGNLVRYWNGNDDLHISEDSEEDMDKAVDDIITKRKYFEKSPENKFQQTGKQKRSERRSKKALNKSN